MVKNEEIKARNKFGGCDHEFHPLLKSIKTFLELTPLKCELYNT